MTAQITVGQVVADDAEEVGSAGHDGRSGSGGMGWHDTEGQETVEGKSGAPVPRPPPPPVGSGQWTGGRWTGGR